MGDEQDNTTAKPTPDSNTGGRDSPPPPPLPPRPQPSTTLSTVQASSRPLQSRATTAVSSVDIQTLAFPDGSRGTFSTTPDARSSGHATPSVPSLLPGASEASDAMSVTSFAPTMRAPGDLASLVAGEFNRKSRAWQLLRSQSSNVPPFEGASVEGPTTRRTVNFDKEFDPVPELSDGVQDEDRLLQWKTKLKHYMILSSAGKPIWSRHGDLSLINSYMGVVQTIISFYEKVKNPLQGFTAGNARFVIATEGPLYFVAISRLGESDAQLREQLKALYMQILSTLTLPTLKRIFVHRPSTDLRKPLEGTESLLSSLADTFTKGSPSSLLSALECLKLRKSQRHSINNAFLKQRTDKLLYGLIVAGGRLVSVIRPRKHSLHPSDLQLIFNMLFQSGGIKAGDGESWIPLCLPAFNSSGYLYMYVSFFEPDSQEAVGSTAPSSTDEATAIILISADRESFFELKGMREKVVQQLAKNGSLQIIQAAAQAGRPLASTIAPGSNITHFLYKSRANVQFAMSSMEAAFGEQSAPQLEARRQLMTLYHELQSTVHARHSNLKILHCISEEATSLAWVTPVFELYCVAGPNASRAIVTQGANRIVQWAKREEERLFIIGGGVF